MRAELQAHEAHEDARAAGEGRLPLQVLRDALLSAVHPGEAHEEVRGEPEQQGWRRSHPTGPHQRRHRRLEHVGLQGDHMTLSLGRFPPSPAAEHLLTQPPSTAPPAPRGHPLVVGPALAQTSGSDFQSTIRVPDQLIKCRALT
uniref:Uncharacterized protein n=1 Tax=Timema bartmani TaxID=61472 RepID=A0A7R9FCY4_9NEOP|nr:unnamed protein product [Timema bartmani]